MTGAIRTPCLALALALAMSSVAGGETVHPGDVAPDFHKTDLDGNAQTLWQYRGKVVVMFLLGYS